MKSLITTIFLFTFFVSGIGMVFAQTADEIQADLRQKESELGTIQSEIQKYQIELNKTREKANTLKNTVAQYETSRRKVNAEVMATDKEISLKNLYIQSLSFDISEKEKDILNRRAVLLASIQ